MSHAQSLWSDFPPFPLSQHVPSLLFPSHSVEPCDPRTGGQSGRLAEQGPLTGWESEPCLSTSLRSSSDVKVDVPTLLFCSSRTNKSVWGKGDAEEQAHKNAEELMTNVATNFATGLVGRSDFVSHTSDLIKAGGWTKEAVEKRPREASDDLVDTTSEKVRPAQR